MQYDERRTLPESTQKYLVQQVQKQSDVCDVIVKMGHWEKKFHRCVLVASPFFDNVLKHNFLEKQTGKIEIKLGTPNTLEMAIMFLYEKIPKLTDDNIEHLLHLAEFLLIPNLKSACISWLKTLNITEKDCMTLLQLSSLYEFENSKCTEYIEAHFSEMLRNSQMVNLTKDSINSLFLDRKLAYVPMDEKLMFFLRWRDAQPENRNVFMKELLSAIDFGDVTQSLLQQLKKDHSLNEIIDIEDVLGNTVLLMKSEKGEGSFWCFEIEREKWFKLSSNAYKEVENRNIYTISGKGSRDFEICFTDNGFQESWMLTLDLQYDTCKLFQFVEQESGRDFNQFNDLQIHSRTCFVYVNKRIERNMKISRFDGNYILQRSGVYTDTSTLYIGQMADVIVRMSPFLTIKDDQISNMCVHNDLTSGILFKSNKLVSVFDLTDHTLEKLEVKTDSNDKIAQSENGFVIYNNKRCICLQRLTGLSLPPKYNSKEIRFDERCSYGKYYFFGNTWYHYYRKSYGEGFKFESAPHSCAMSEGSVKNITWKPLPLPIDPDRCNKDTIKDHLVQICVPKSKLCCNIEYSDGKIASRESASERTFTDYDIYNDDFFYDLCND